jgi:RHS repeat-associated protein
VARFVYDGLGRRAQKISSGVTRTYVYEAENALEERLSSGATIRYVHAPGIDQPMAGVQSGTATYYLADHLGSILLTTDASAAVTLTRQYDPWGNLLQGSATAGYAFTGREWDPEIGLYFFRARYYDPKVGRFLSEDSIRDGLNTYAYVANAPSRFVDPSGLLKTKIRWTVDQWPVGRTIPGPVSITWECKGTTPCDSGKGDWKTEFTVAAVIAIHVSASCPPWSLRHEQKHALQFTTNILSSLGPLRDAEGQTYDCKSKCEAASAQAAAKAGKLIQQNINNGSSIFHRFTYVPCWI